MAGQVLAVDARLVVVAIDVGVGDEAAQVPVADQVLSQQDQVEGLGVGLALLVGHRPAGDVGLDPDDRLDALGAGRLVEGDGAVQGAVVGDRHRVHAELGGRVHELRDPPETVEQAELGVDVEVREVVRGQGRHGRSMVAGRWAVENRRTDTRRPASVGPQATLRRHRLTDACRPADEVLHAVGEGGGLDQLQRHGLTLFVDGSSTSVFDADIRSAAIRTTDSRRAPPRTDKPSCRSVQD